MEIDNNMLVSHLSTRMNRAWTEVAVIMRAGDVAAAMKSYRIGSWPINWQG